MPGVRAPRRAGRGGGRGPPGRELWSNAVAELAGAVGLDRLFEVLDRPEGG